MLDLSRAQPGILLAAMLLLTPRLTSRPTPSLAVSCTRRAGASLLSEPTAQGEVLPRSFFEALDYSVDSVQWDLRGQPQPAVRAAAQSGDFGQPGTVILDCGSGAGDNAKMLCALGYDVLGFDVSASAVSTAMERCESSNGASAARHAIDQGTVEFVQASATDLGSAARVQERARELGGFEVALDSALIHCLDDADQRAYLAGVRKLVRPGGSLYVGCFSDSNLDPWQNPRRMSEAQLRALLAPRHGWQLDAIREVWYRRPTALASNGGAWTMAWWCHAKCLPADPFLATPSDGVEGESAGTPTPRKNGLMPKWLYRTKVDDGEFSLLLARSDGDQRLPAPILRGLTSKWRLVGAWRASPQERGTCFGLLGADEMWGEEFFLLDRA